MYQIQKKILDAPLDIIVPNGQVKEQGSEQGKEQTAHLIPRITKVPAKDNPNERPPKESLREKSYAQRNKGPKEQRKPQKLEKNQTLHFPQDK